MGEPLLTLCLAMCVSLSPQGLKRCHSGTEVDGALQKQPSLKRACTGPRSVQPPPQLQLPEQPFMADEPLLPAAPAAGPAAAAVGNWYWPTGLTPRVGACWGCCWMLPQHYFSGHTTCYYELCLTADKAHMYPMLSCCMIHFKKINDDCATA